MTVAKIVNNLKLHLAVISLVAHNYFLLQHFFLPPLFSDAIIVTNLKPYLDAISLLASTNFKLHHLFLQPLGADATILTNHEQ